VSIPNKPILAITMGDAAGVGPEIIIKALNRPEIQEICRPLVIGDLVVMQKAVENLKLPIKVARITDSRQAIYGPGIINVYSLDNIRWEELTIGKVSAMAGKAAVEYVIAGTKMVQSGEAAALVTAPLNKEAMHLGGYKQYIGHTEILAELTGSNRETTMLTTPGPDDGREHIPLRVVHVTRHIPFKDIAAHITQAQVLETIQITDEGLRALKIAKPRLAVAALNPHGGEGGILGREEIEQIGPAIKAAQKLGIDARGPYPADSIFYRAMAGEFDAAVAMYHDQGHIAIKVYGFEASVTVTLGLPIWRTSVDHGTAFDIAWKGQANPRSMIESIKLGATLGS
jgi:4-hydroxythreonine-4-phosphate dehydrogenase